MKRNRRNDACERGGIAARRFSPSSRRQPVPTGRRRLHSNPARGRAFRLVGSGLWRSPAGRAPPRAQARLPRALETIGIHLNIALGLSNEVGPPHSRQHPQHLVPRWPSSMTGWPDTVTRQLSYSMDSVSSSNRAGSARLRWATDGGRRRDCYTRSRNTGGTDGAVNSGNRCPRH